MSKGETTGASSISSGLQFKYLLDKKADKTELKELFDQKSCKNDTEMALRWIQIVHK